MHLVVGGDIGGAERLLVDLASRPDISGASHQVALFTPNRALFELLRDAGLRVHDRGHGLDTPLAYLHRSLGPADARWLARLLEDERIDILHSHTFATHVLGARAARQAKRLHLRTEHHVVHYFDPSCSPFTRWAAARTDAFVAVSEYVRSVLQTTAPRVAARTTVVRNGVDTAHFAPRPPREGEGGGFRLAIVCRLTAWKRVHLAIEAAKLAGCELWVVGDGEERAKLEALAAGGRVRFVGHQRDPRPFVAECDATLSAAKDEPLGLSVLESLSMERPVIACKGGGLTEIIQHEKTGLLVDEPTQEALAAAITRLAGDRGAVRRMGEAGRRFVMGECSIERMCRGYGEVYGRLAGRS